MFPFVKRRSASWARAIAPMKNPTRKKTSRRFRAEFTERPTECCANETDSFLYRINVALPGLTSRRTFDVISFANCSLFCIGKDERFCRHEIE